MPPQLIKNMNPNCNGHMGDVKELVKKRRRREITKRPVYLLSSKLIDTYKSINRKHMRLIGNGNQGYEDEDYNYILSEGEMIGRNYFIQGQSLVGNGSFGKVYRAKNTITEEYVAVKIIKSKRQLFVQSQLEIEILRHLERNDPHGEFHICYLLDSFVYRNHQCLVFEMLSVNLYDLLKLHNFKVCVWLHVWGKGLGRGVNGWYSPGVFCHC